MKCFRRYFCVLCVLVLSLTVFSINASAKNVDVRPYKITSVVYGRYSNGLQYNYSYTFSPNSTDTYTYTHTNWGEYIYEYRNTLRFNTEDGSPLILKGEKATISINNIQVSCQVNYSNGNTMGVGGIDRARLLLIYSDGTSQYIDDVQIIGQSTYFDILSTFDVPKDIATLEVIMETDIDCESTIKSVDYYLGMKGTSTYAISLNQPSEEAGLLSGLIGWVRNLFDKVSSGFDSVVSGFVDMKNGFSNIGTWFSELPTKLWNVISEGLKNLFVPDEEFMTDYSDRWDELLSSRFGAIYQVGTIITDFAERIQVSDKTNTITIPEVNLNSVGIPFSFGGYNVQIVPNGFDFIVETLKIIVSIVCTFMFVNGLRKRYDEVMGVEQ